MYPMFWTVLGMLNSSKLGDLTDGWVCLLVIIAFRKSLIFCEHGIETASHLPFWLNYNHLLTWKIAVIIWPFGNDSPFFQPIIPMWRHDVCFSVAAPCRWHLPERNSHLPTSSTRACRWNHLRYLGQVWPGLVLASRRTLPSKMEYGSQRHYKYVCVCS